MQTSVVFLYECAPIATRNRQSNPSLNHDNYLTIHQEKIVVFLVACADPLFSIV